jgi:capsular polysaccharide transport system permease protein
VTTIELSRSGAPRDEIATRAAPARPRRRADLPALLILLVAFVLPSAFAVVYFGFLAATLHVAETRFVVRAAPAMTASEDPLALLAATGRGRERAVETHVITNFLRSRNLVAELDADGTLRRVFNAPPADFLARLGDHPSLERLWLYWQTRVVASVDLLSGIVTVRVTAFRREDALELAQLIARRTETLVNAYTNRVRGDTLTAARRAMEAAGRRHAAALVALRDVRQGEGVIDPAQQVTEAATTLLGLQQQRVLAERERLATIRLTSQQAPAVRALGDRVRALDEQIVRAQSELTNRQNAARTASRSLARFEEAELERVFSERLFGIQIAALESARLEYERQQVFLLPVVPPHVPDESPYPRRLPLILLTMFLSAVVWLAARTILAVTRDVLH